MKSKRSSPKISNISSGIFSNKFVLYLSFFFAIVTAANYLLKNNLEAVAIFIIIGLLTTYFSKNMIVVLLTTTILTNFIVMFKNGGKSSYLEGMTTEELSKLKTEMDDAKKAMDNEKDATKKAELEIKYNTAKNAYDNAKLENEIKETSKPNEKDAASTKDMPSMPDKPATSTPSMPSSVGSENTVSMGAVPANEVQKPLNGKPSVKDGMSQLKPASVKDEVVDPMMKNKVPGMATGYNAQKEQAYDTLNNIGGGNNAALEQQTAMVNNLKSIEPILNTAQNFLDKFENSSISKMFSGGLGNIPGMSLLTGGSGGSKTSPAPVSSE